jgi:hypothetical protein
MTVGDQITIKSLITLKKDSQTMTRSIPMTDLKRFRAMLTSSGIEFEERGREEVTFIIEEGYVGFFTNIRFNKEGRLVSIKAYE